MTEEMDLPKGWAFTNLESIISISSGKGLPKTKMVDGDIPVYGGNGVTGMHNAPNVIEPTIVIGRVGFYCGSVHLTPQDAWVTDNAFITRFNSQCLDKMFLYRLLTATNLRGDDSSTAQPVISGRKVYPIEILLPPLAEQKVIADKLGSLLAQVETTKARLDRIPDILKRFRQSVLAAAVSGRLSEEWRGTSDLSVSSEYSEWKWESIPESWSIELYPDVFSSRLGKMLDKAKNTGLTTKYLGNINVRWFRFDLNNTQEILVSESERVELSLDVGDVLICEGGEPGRCAVWNVDSSSSMVFQKALHRARSKGQVLPDWLTYNLKNDANSLVLEQLFTGTTIKHLTGKALKKYPLRIPPIAEQTEIVRRVEELFAYADAVEQKAQAASERVNNLTQSILAKAFRGDLTKDWRAANPDLISGENSAEALLEKIKAERETLKPKKKTRTKKVKG